MGRVRQIGSVAGASVAHSVAALAASVLLARLLGPAGRGQYALATLVVSLSASLGTLGFEAGNTFAVGRRTGTAGQLVWASLVLAACSGGILVLGLNTLGRRAGELLPNLEPGSLALASLAIPFLILSSLLYGLLLGLGLVSRAVWANVSGVLLSIGLMVVAGWLVPNRLNGMLLVFVGSSVLVAAALLRIAVGTAGIEVRDPRPIFRENLGYSLVSHGGNLLHLLHLRLDVFIVNLFLTPVEVGLYALALAVAEWAWLLPRAAAAVIMPLLVASDPEAALEHTARTSRMVTLLSSLTAAGLALGAGWLVPWLFGRAFAGSVTPLRIVLSGLWLAGAVGILSAFLSGRGHPRYPFFTSVICLIVNVTLNLVLIPRLGIAGAAAASAITYALSMVLNICFVRRLSPVTLRRLLLPGWKELSGLVTALRSRPVAR